MKNTTGWVMFDKINQRYCGGRWGMPYTVLLKDAYVYESREGARIIHIRRTDRILKVSLDTNGRPVAVIGRG